MTSRSMQTMFTLLITLLLFLPAKAVAADITANAGGQPAQEGPERGASPERTPGFDAHYFSGYVDDFSALATAPARWDRADWLTTAAVLGAAAGLYDNDAKIQKWVLDHKTTDTSRLGDELTHVGHGKFTPVLVGGLYAYGVWRSDARAARTALLSIESFVLTGVFTQIIKYSAGRHRPNTGDPPHTWDGTGGKKSSATMSFPSGHASSAFAVASVIAAEYDYAVIPPVAYAVASITALNRVSHNAHWASDVFTGSALGYFTGRFLVLSHRKPGKLSLFLSPVIEGPLSGIALNARF